MAHGRGRTAALWGAVLTVAGTVGGFAALSSGTAAGALTLPAAVSLSPATMYMQANGVSYEKLTATVTNGSGAPASGVAVLWHTSGNAMLSPAVSTTDTYGHSTIVVTASTTPGPQTITATAGLVSGKSTLYLWACADLLHLSLGSNYVDSAGPTTVPLSLTVTDYHSPPDPVPGAPLTFTTSGADTVGNLVDHGDGTYSATVFAPGPGTDTITVTTGGGCINSASQVLDVYGPAANVTLALDRTSIPAIGVTQPPPLELPITDPNGQIAHPYIPEPPVPTATATVTDAGGNRVVDEAVQFTATGGITFGAVTNHGDGTYAAELVSSHTPDTESVTATAQHAGISSASVPIAETFGALHVSGTQVLDANNRPVVLRGVNFGPNAPDPSGLINEFPEAAIYDGLAGWGVNVVRAQIDLDQWMQSCWEGPDGSPGTKYDPNYKAAFEEFVAAATERGMYVILSLGSTPRWNCDMKGSHGQIIAERDLVNSKDDALAFWRNVAQTFASNPLVGFELYNEPHIGWADAPLGSSPDGVWLNGGIVDNGSWIAAGMQGMYDAVRNAGAGNLVFVDGNNWANEPPPALIGSAASTTHATDAPTYNVVYAAHWWTCQSRDPTYGTAGDSSPSPYVCALGGPPVPTASCPTSASPPSWDNVAVGLDPWVAWRTATGQAFIEDEFGWPGNSAPVDSCFNQATVAYDEANGIPWLAFNFTRWAGYWNLALDPGIGNFGPSVSGQPVLAALAANFDESY